MVIKEIFKTLIITAICICILSVGFNAIAKSQEPIYVMDKDGENDDYQIMDDGDFYCIEHGTMYRGNVSEETLEACLSGAEGRFILYL